MTLYLDIRNFTKAKIKKSALRKIALKTLGVFKIKGSIGISLAIVGERRIKTLNKKYRRVASVTDVLAFGQSSQKNRFVEPPDGVLRLGEIIICLERAKKQANFFGHSLEKELATLFVHGILHLLGLSDETPAEKKRMEKIQEKVLLKLSFNKLVET